MSSDTTQDMRPAEVEIDPGMPHLNVSCRSCRVSRTFLTLQGVNAFFLEHDGHNVVESNLFDPSALENGETEPEREPARQEEQIGELAGGSVAVTVQEPAVAEAEPEPAQQAALPVQVEESLPSVAAPPSESEPPQPLLLARSSYIGDSGEKRAEAARVSRVLEEFRWNVEPPYVIGVMLNNNLSIETNIGVISSSMVEKVQGLGYRLVAVNAPQGSPVAWFKREAADRGGAPLGEAEKTMEISHGKRTYDKDSAVREESFVSLLMTVKDMDGQRLKEVADIIRSAKPEPEMQSHSSAH